MRRTAPLPAALLLACFILAPPASAQGRDLLRLLDDDALAPPEAVQARPVAVDLAALKEGTELRLPLLDGAVHRAVRTGVERRGPGEMTWRGEVRGPAGAVGSVILTASGELLTGLITMPGAVYQVIPGDGGTHLLAEIDAGALAPCAGGVLPEGGGPLPAPLTAAEAEALSKATAGPTSIDLLVLYTSAARRGGGGARRLRLAIQNSVDVTNSAFAQSRIDARVNLVSVQEFPYAEAGFASTDLRWLRDDRRVAALRQAVGADVVSLFVEQMTDACGIGYLMNGSRLSLAFAPNAFNVVRRVCAANMVLAHEIGHNLGCEHDPDNGEPPSFASFPYSFGHFVDGSFRTIMSYATECVVGCTRIERFSNPEVAWQGEATGVADQRDNHRTINNTRGITAGFQKLQPCRPGPDHLCLVDRRFRVEAVWENQFDGTSGVAKSVPRGDVAGFFHFGDPANVELMVKLLDFDDAVKVFYGQLTNLRFSLIVTDTATGEVKVYANGPAECGAIDPVGFASAGAPARAKKARARAAAGSCRAGRDALCLDRRFRVEVAWHNPGDGSGGAAGAVPMSRQTGAFFFTSPGNLELLAKVVDYGDRIDFFYGALSNLEYTITVTDTATGAVKTYRNPSGTYCGGFDDHAF